MFEKTKWMRYGSRSRKLMKQQLKNRFNVNFQDHHLIPKTFKNHPLIRKTGFAISDSKNLLVMPASKHERVMGMNHTEYNQFIFQKLGEILNMTQDLDESRYEIYLFISYLIKNIKDDIF